MIIDPYNKHLGGCILGQPNGVGDIDTWVPQIWDRLIEDKKIKSVIDVGCGGGYSLKYFLKKGIDGLGIEGLRVAREVSPVKDKIYIHDYTIHEYIPSKEYDLAWCCEFVEHVEEKYINNYMKTLDMCKIVAMTHAVPGQQGYNHVNEQLPEYWINVFSKYNFKYEEEYSLNLRKLLLDKKGNPLKNGKWVRNSLMVFSKA